MTWVIFCPLAVCALQIVFAADLANHIAASIDRSLAPMIETNYETDNAISAVAETVKNKEINSDELVYECTSTLRDAAEKLARSSKYKQQQCEKYYREAKNIKDIQFAENFCKKLAEEYKREANSYVSQTKTCIADIAKKCAKSASECRKEVENKQKARDKEYQIGEKVRLPPNMK
ncbi:uncharacterized protein LOC117175415 [Belonocnema kinseyi]|uniref:uncharacterized protein LOC117175415 n=1 Tax=Belonocnema kinseyi TaxID=2817044 RepID=UPI00143DC048|nr:uncharacterized protein LOC117175415 [Belonocnema kinseyi]